MKIQPGKLISNVDAKRFNTWHVGGIVPFAYAPLNAIDAADFIVNDKRQKIWLGLGSNVLLPDDFSCGLILPRFGMRQIVHNEDIWTIDVGVSLARLAKTAEKQGRDGPQYFAGVPGTVGGALVMNAGAWGREFWQFVKQVQVISPKGDLVWLDASEFDIGYRTVNGPKNLGFTACRCFFPEGQTVSLKSLLKKRNDSQPVGSFNCGSVFTNPPGDSAGRLIEDCGLKGFSIGDAIVSDKHANFIINLGSATFDDITSLIRHIQETVLRYKDVQLSPEVKIYATQGWSS